MSISTIVEYYSDYIRRRRDMKPIGKLMITSFIALVVSTYWIIKKTIDFQNYGCLLFQCRSEIKKSKLPITSLDPYPKEDGDSNCSIRFSAAFIPRISYKHNNKHFGDSKYEISSILVFSGDAFSIIGGG
jgi:hypothetical protein